MSNLQTLLEKLRALDEKATEVPWFIDGEEIRFDCSPETTSTGIDCTIQICTVSRLTEKLDDLADDRILIAEMRNALSLLLEIIEKQREALEKLDKWQGERYCYGSIFTIDDDTFGQMQSLIHGAMEDCDQIAAMVK